MFSRLIKVTFVGCFLIAASLPAEAGLFDRILRRHAGRTVPCCNLQPVCTPISCAPKPCVPSGCASNPCASCLEGYRANLELCKVFFGNDPALCLACQKEAAKGYCECLSAPNSFRMYGVACAAHPEEPTIESCGAFKLACEKLQQEGGPNNCSLCWFECLRQIPTTNPVPDPNSNPIPDSNTKP